MTTEQHKTLLSYYKSIVKGNDNSTELKQELINARVQHNEQTVKNLPTEDIQEYITELNTLLY